MTTFQESDDTCDDKDDINVNSDDEYDVIQTFEIDDVDNGRTL